MKKLMIFIPAYNAERTICKVLKRLPENVKKKASSIVIFDNCSSDNTYKVAQEFKKKHKWKKLEVHRNKKNLHYGGNLKAGCKYAVKKKMDIIVELHADGQYPPEHIINLIEPIEKGEAVASSGSRFLGDPLKGKMPLWRYSGNIFLTKVQNGLVGRSFSEWHSGFRAYDCNALKKVKFGECVEGYEWTTDVFLMLIAKGFPIAEIPIPTYYGEDSTSPSIQRTFEYFLRSFALSGKYLLHRSGVKRNDKYTRVR